MTAKSMIRHPAIASSTSILLIHIASSSFTASSDSAQGVSPGTDLF
jgi:hypothetical protein